jgi:type I site-specific restriction endonuclease
MGLFGNNLKKIIQEIRIKSEHYSNDMSKEIDEFVADLKSDYNENSTVIPEFEEFVQKIKHKLDSNDAYQLEEFSTRLTRVRRCAKNGVDAMMELSRDHKKLTRESSRDFEEYTHI